jgi:two-component system sensor histidine kinase QseC
VIALQRHSLSRRLLFSLIVVTLGCWGVIAWLTVQDSSNEIDALFDAHLAQTALALLRVTDPDEHDPAVMPVRPEDPALRGIFRAWPELPERLGGAGLSTTPQTSNGVPAAVGSTNAMHAAYERNLRYQVWSGQGTLILSSANAPAVAMTEHDGYSQSTDRDGRVWRHYGVWDQHHDFRILVSEAHDLRGQLVRRIALHVASPLALALPVWIFLLWISIRRGLDPLRILAREIAKRKPQNLMPIDESGAPHEVRPMVLALNDLLQRMTRTLEGEQRFTAHAAHELRTPLAAIQAQLYLAHTADGKTQRMQAMTELQHAVERAIRLVSQMLILARLDPEQALPDAQAVSLGEVVQLVCAELAPLALQRDQTLDLVLAPELPSLSGNADMLSIMIRNLVDNAIRYTQRGGHISIDVRNTESDLRIQVSDDGPGIPATQRERVFDRFYRLAGQEQSGTGLGLAITRRIAELHKARIVLAEGPFGQGVTVSVLFSVVQE